MINRIFPPGKKKPAVPPLTYLPFSLFGDPASLFRSLPASDHHPWALPAVTHSRLRMAIGMAWLNGRRIRIHTAGQGLSEAVRAWATGCTGDAALLLQPQKDNDLPALSADLVRVVRKWQEETRRFHEALQQVSDIRFGVIDALEAAFTLIRLHPSVETLPFGRTGRKDMAWTPEEYEGLLRSLDEARKQAHGLEAIGWAEAHRIHLDALEPWNLSALQSALDDRLDRLEGFIRQYEKSFFRLYHLSNPREEAGTSLPRASLTGLEAGVLHRSGLDTWLPAFRLFEQELISDGWLYPFRGLQSISLEETGRELNRLYERLHHLRQHAGLYLEASACMRWLEGQPPVIRHWMEAAPRIARLDLQTPLTYWYVHGWLEQAVPPAIWHDLAETEERRQLSRSLPALMAQRFRVLVDNGHLPRDPEEWWEIREGGDSGVPREGTVDLYVSGNEEGMPENAFVLTPHEQPVLSLEYLRLQQAPLTEPGYDPLSLPYPLCALEALWEATPGRVMEVSPPGLAAFISAVPA
ncbi:MAG: hypothetical protein J5I41_07915 [Saprospiraceae bacterium]|nr:hypothetical protein [Saprospiraceae bacterium]